MQINTKTGAVRVSIPELKILENAYGLLQQIKLYNAGGLGAQAEGAQAAIDVICKALKPQEIKGE